MITRLKVSGFKSLVDVDIRFGPFTCIAGTNGTGKSNLFDAIHFLGALAENDLANAARLIRNEGEKSPDIRSLFSHFGERYADAMTFEVELIVPPKGIDRLGQTGKAKTTLLKYSLALGYKEDKDSTLTKGKLEILSEELTSIRKGDAPDHLRFPHKAKEWRSSVLVGKSVHSFISTSTDAQSGKTLIKVHQEGRQGRTRNFIAETLPRTVLSDSSALESPTASVARHEMLSWRFLQLEPSALRRAAEFSDPANLDANGANLPSTLYALARKEAQQDSDAGAERIYSNLANRLSELLDDVREVMVERDDKRELLTLMVAGRDRAFHAARSLSDGTLRFIALAVMELESGAGVVCLEEPENGIHPSRIEPMIQLLQDIAMDVDEAVDDTNPLRQVILNTHSPVVVQLVPEDALLVAERYERISEQGSRFAATRFLPLTGTWRTGKDQSAQAVPLGKLLGYLNPVPASSEGNAGLQTRRVMDRTDVQQLELQFDDAETGKP